MKILVDEELLKQSLEALENSIDSVQAEFDDDWRHGVPTREKQLKARAEVVETHKQAIAGIRGEIQRYEIANTENKAWEHLKPYGYAPGYYSGKCCECGKEWFNQDKYAWVCRECAEKMCAAGGSTVTTKLDATQEIEFLEALLAADNALIEGLKKDLADCKKQRNELTALLEHLLEYWNGSNSESAMHDALTHFDETIRDALAKLSTERKLNDQNRRIVEAGRCGNTGTVGY